jgi:hypothetical protein
MATTVPPIPKANPRTPEAIQPGTEFIPLDDEHIFVGSDMVHSFAEMKGAEKCNIKGHDTVRFSL